ncbi:transcription antiterminator [Acidaminobacter sp. JC074]|uniref:BglG family transcription antiterminator n=1 Tax=Acidaminobacter sp. JC074 TaxID=2530199 RepID=UPI001F103879|nr:transcription antiterminator [Acidaminobacter sp. JC074]MCH4889526.1 transcription antiterminator [Acidaminobacter sp. JC074]
MQLSNRKKQILAILIREDAYVTAANISKELSVSRRTILRELASVEEWLNQQGIDLKKVTGKGMCITVDQDVRSELSKQLDHEKVDHTYTPYERQRKILLELLNASQPLKIFYFSHMLGVSEATVSYDLDKIDTWLASYHLNLIRKPGFGIVIEGRESNFRKAIIHLFNEYFDRGELLHLIKDDFIDQNTLYKKTSVKNTLLDVVGYSLLESIEEALKVSNALEAYQLADNAYASLVIHLSLAIKRLNNGENIHFNHQKLEEIKESREFEMGYKIAKAIESTFSIMIPDDEIGYIAMHLQGARLRLTRNNRLEIKVQDYEVIYLIEKLIQEMETITGYILVGNQQLVSGLINHFGPAIARIKQGVEIKNPLLEEMKVRYPLYFNSVSKAVKILEKHLQVLIPDDEIAYLTMHFAAAVESIKKNASSYWKVAIVCSTGIGSSKLLEARIKKQYKNMIIQSVLSSIELKKQDLSEIDLIISTVKVEVNKPIVVVSPLLLEEDMRRVENVLNSLTPLREDKESISKNINFVQKLNELSTITEAALEILNNYFILRVEKPSLDAFSQKAADYICFDCPKDELVDELKLREEKGITWFDEKKGRLLHCQSKVVNQLYFGFVLSNQNDYAAIMVGHSNLNIMTRKLLGHISLNLIENENWLHAVKLGDLEKSYNTLETIVQEYFESFLKGGSHA